jgi:hypothetical protein
MHTIKKLILITLLFCYSACIYAWDSTGHRVIAAIAYDNLTPAAKMRADALTQILDPGYPALQRFLYVSALPDKWRNNQRETRAWHFYSTPWTTDHSATKTAPTPNLITSLNQNIEILKASANINQQATAFAFVLHLLGDAHQPLHCINRFSEKYPKGDHGGNAVKISSNYADNLHTWWDRGVRLLIPKKSYPLRTREITKLATRLQQQYPQHDFKNSIMDANISEWVRNCSELATTVAYHLPPSNRFNNAYRTAAKQVIETQLTLAGYRLASLLNDTFK